MWKSTANTLLKRVEGSYDLISEHFSETRKQPWRDFELFKKFIRPGCDLLDVGCGNGRLSVFLNDLNLKYVGVDLSSKLIDQACRLHPELNFKIGSAIELPCDSESFDVVCSVACLHHIPSDFSRQKAISEMYRVLKPGGILILSVWNLRQIRKYRSLIYESFFRNILTLGKYDYGDVFVPWKAQNGAKISERYYYAFSLDKFRLAVSDGGFLILKYFGANNGSFATEEEALNLFVIAQR